MEQECLLIHAEGPILSLKMNKNGCLFLLIHISDVSYIITDTTIQLLTDFRSGDIDLKELTTKRGKVHHLLSKLTQLSRNNYYANQDLKSIINWECLNNLLMIYEADKYNL